MNYPSPQENSVCKCKANPMAAFFCDTGHMTECHYPYTCSQAGCSHLRRYDFTEEQADTLEAEAKFDIENGGLPPYKLDEDGNIVVEPGESHEHFKHNPG